MRVSIIGAGSIGLLIGSFLAADDFSVTMVVRTNRQKEALLTKGIHRRDSTGAMQQCAVNATKNVQVVHETDICIVAVKYKDISSICETLHKEGVRTPLLFVQNGLAHVAEIAKYDFPDVAFGSVEHGALKESDYLVNHNGIGNMTVGYAKGKHPAIRHLLTATQTQFPMQLHEDVMDVLLRKVLINCMINPLTTILQVKNGVLIENVHSKHLMQALYDECMEAFPHMKTKLTFEDVERICQQTKDNNSSMLVDYQSGRKMEIATIVTAVIQLAADKGRKLPYLTIYEQLLWALDGKVQLDD